MQYQWVTVLKEC